MKFVFFCVVALSVVGLLCCHELDDSVYNGFDSPLIPLDIPLDNNDKIHQIWNNLNDFFKNKINSFHLMLTSIFPSDQVYPENFFTKNVLKRDVRSANDNTTVYQKFNQSTDESHVSITHIALNKTEETSIPTNIINKVEETSILANTNQSKTGPSVSMSTTHNKTDLSVSEDTILNVSTNSSQSKTDPSISMNTTKSIIKPDLNFDKTTENSTNVSVTSLTSLINNHTGKNATLDRDTKENTLLSSDTNSYGPWKILFVLALLGVVLGLFYVVYKKQQRVRNACYQVRDICRNNDETPV